MSLSSWLESESITSWFKRFLEVRVRSNKLEPGDLTYGLIWGLIIGVNFIILSILIGFFGTTFYRFSVG